MPTAKLVFRDKQPYKDGTCPVMLRVIANRVVKELQLCRVSPKDWNPEKMRVRNSNPKHRELNQLLSDRVKLAEDGIFEAHRTVQPINSETLIAGQRPQRLCFLNLIEEYVAARDAQGKIHTAEKYTSNLNQLKKYLGKGKSLEFHEVTESFILRYIKWERDQGTGPNTLHRRIEFFRSVTRAHCEREAQAGRFVFNPFTAEAVQVKKGKVRKHRLTEAEVEALETIELPMDRRTHHARLAWLLQYYLRGIRISDALMLKAENIVGDRVEFVTIKASTFQSVKIHPKLHHLLETLRQFKTPYLLPLMTWKADPAKTQDENLRAMWKQIEAKTMIVNQNLAKVEKLLGFPQKLRTHIARHTFAREADKRVLDKKKISGMLGHSTFRMTETYLEALRDDDLDAAADEVFR